MRLLNMAQAAVTRLSYGKEQGVENEHFYELFDTRMNGEPVCMDAFKGDVPSR